MHSKLVIVTTDCKQLITQLHGLKRAFRLQHIIIQTRKMGLHRLTVYYYAVTEEEK